MDMDADSPLVDSPLVNPEEFPAWILHEDEELLVLNKPGWLVCHPSKNGPWSSLVGAAREYTSLDVIRLVSRLDRETSGVVVLAKTPKTGRLWQKAVEARQAHRTYHAIVEGTMTQPTTVDAKIGKDGASAVFVKQCVKNTNTSKRAITHFTPVYQNNGYSLVEIKTETGRKHQIRVHAQHIGHPLLGEKLYGHNEQFYLEFIEHGLTEHLQQALGFPRQALHSGTITLALPDQEPLSFHAPLPNDMKDFLREKMNWQESDRAAFF